MQTIFFTDWKTWALPLSIKVFTATQAKDDPLGQWLGFCISMGPVSFAAKWRNWK